MTSLDVHCCLLRAGPCNRVDRLRDLFVPWPVLVLSGGNGSGTMVSLPTIDLSTGLFVPARPRTYSFRGMLLFGSLFVVVIVRNSAWNIGATKSDKARSVNTAGLIVNGIRTSAVTNRRL